MESWYAVICCVVIAVYYLIWKKNGAALPPGPLGLPLLGHLPLLGSFPHRSLHKLSDKFGPIMSIRLGRVPTIVVSSPEAAELILKTHDLVFASRPKLKIVEYVNLLFVEYGPRLRNVRKVCTLHLLSNSKVESLKSLRKEHLKGLVGSLVREAQAGAVVDLTAKVGSLIEDITFEMILGRTKDDRVDFNSNAQEIMRLGGKLDLGDYIPFIGALDLQGIGRRLKHCSKVLETYLENIIDEHKREGNTRKEDHRDFIDVMLSLADSNNDKEEQLDHDTMKGILLDMMIGAMDTSTTTIEWILSELFINPRIMKQVQSELDDIVGMDRTVEEVDLAKLDYLDLVIKEAMRLHPVGPLLAPREATEDITLNGYYIPKKTRVIVNIWAIGRDPNVWSKNVNEFYPERFCGENMDFGGHDFRFLPFGAGRRGCLGTQLAVITVRLIVAQLVHCFNWELLDGDLDMTEKFGLSMPRAHHLLAKPTFRLK